MARSLCPVVPADGHARLGAIVADRDRPPQHACRTRSDRAPLGREARRGGRGAARRVGIGRPAAWRWQRRFAEAGVEGLLRDRTRKPGKPPPGEAVAQQVVALTCAEPPGEAAQWTGRAMAKAVGLSLRSVRRIWAAHKLQPHRPRAFKRSRDPDFLAKLEATVGLYLRGPAPPRRAAVLSVDEKPRVQALDCTRPGLPVKEGRRATMTHGYGRHGTTAPSAALNVSDGTVLGRCMQRHRHQEFPRFLAERNADPKPFTWTKSADRIAPAS